ncbi:MAG: GNAT family N-acetyltransferase [Gemmatimonadota bacterium]|nr:GNAT family N-acetyltransferase [Gemmatimonadota bacterium]MDE3171455.1 GNAT family N-acetyltransferase [Gemmatimonadota bacterium]
MPLESFSTPRLHAERLVEAHLDEIRRMHGDARVMALLGGVRTEQQSRDYLDRNLEHWERYGFGLWIVYTSARDTVVGRACVRHLDVEGTPEVEIGYALYPEWWGQGLATEIANRCIGIGRSELGLQSLVAVAHPANGGSRHVMEKVGMFHERDVVLAGERLVLYRTGERAARRSWP